MSTLRNFSNSKSHILQLNLPTRQRSRKWFRRLQHSLPNRNRLKVPLIVRIHRIQYPLISHNVKLAHPLRATLHQPEVYHQTDSGGVLQHLHCYLNTQTINSQAHRKGQYPENQHQRLLAHPPPEIPNPATVNLPLLNPKSQHLQNLYHICPQLIRKNLIPQTPPVRMNPFNVSTPPSNPSSLSSPHLSHSQAFPSTLMTTLPHPQPPLLRLTIYLKKNDPLRQTLISLRSSPRPLFVLFATNMEVPPQEGLSAVRRAFTLSQLPGEQSLTPTSWHGSSRKLRGTAIATQVQIPTATVTTSSKMSL